ncbi:unnamed protein product [Prunus armeniaca]|uniref:Uncharacterized protein n=1 Tax=Prunus armeniaca TaxID=36596 RepID=A0A6J5UTH8_PRUAR|nr:unnamed protein product [Prunus armeniaca]CAB4277278.1 unnamed protein product [Prunus armeniaca]CAB4307649.1 unnamed protein product [Prunus armeniaca]CAB4307683.1 unnamed protein product [Prunus armeniaca]
MNHMVEERKWPGRRCRAIRSEAHTQRLMEGGVTFTCLRPGSIIVESGRAPGRVTRFNWMVTLFENGFSLRKLVP